MSKKQYDFSENDKIYSSFTLFDDFTFIYALLDENENIVYIGKAKNVYTRICAHLLDKEKAFSYFKYIKVPADEASEVEFKLYAKYSPKFNRVPPQTEKWKSLSNFRKINNMKGCGWAIKKYIKNHPIESIEGLYPIEYLEIMKEELTS